ncbi:ABC transporter permease, partial [bacterium]|nr:ABC transporter permease [bacterium]
MDSLLTTANLLFIVLLGTLLWPVPGMEEPYYLVALVTVIEAVYLLRGIFFRGKSSSTGAGDVAAIVYLLLLSW